MNVIVTDCYNTPLSVSKLTCFVHLSLCSAVTYFNSCVPFMTPISEVLSWFLNFSVCYIIKLYSYPDMDQLEAVKYKIAHSLASFQISAFNLQCIYSSFHKDVSTLCGNDWIVPKILLTGTWDLGEGDEVVGMLLEN